MDTTLAAQIGESMTEWKYTKGSCRVAYMSLAVAPWVLSAAPIAGWPHVAGKPLLSRLMTKTWWMAGTAPAAAALVGASSGQAAPTTRPIDATAETNEREVRTPVTIQGDFRRRSGLAARSPV